MTIFITFIVVEQHWTVPSMFLTSNYFLRQTQTIRIKAQERIKCFLGEKLSAYSDYNLLSDGDFEI